MKHSLIRFCLLLPLLIAPVAAESAVGQHLHETSAEYDDCFWKQQLYTNWHLKASVKKLLESFSHSENESYNDRELHDSRHLGLSFEYRY